MAKYTAKYIGSTKADTRYYDQHWEYRGRAYIVTVPCSWNCSSDYNNDGYMSQKNQHKRAQDLIDGTLDNPHTEEKPQAQAYEGSAQEGLDIFFNFVEQG